MRTFTIFAKPLCRLVIFNDVKVSWDNMDKPSLGDVWREDSLSSEEQDGRDNLSPEGQEGRDRLSKMEEPKSSGTR